MKSPLEQLTVGERELLANFIDTPTHIALRKLLDIERLELAKDHVGQTDILLVRYLSGQDQSLRKLILTLRNNYKSQTSLDKKRVKQKR